MKVSTSWLSDYVPIELAPADLAEALTMIGLEVESVSERYRYLDSVLVGRIETVESHPHSAKLKICRVNAGDRQVSVVCGAPNVKAGMLAPLALPGTVLPDGSRLEKSVIRGQSSEGVLCSSAELELDIDPSGIMVLNPSLKVGDPLVKALDLTDTVFEFDLTPNRPDCLSVLGIAREIAAIQNTPLRYPDYDLSDTNDAIATRTSVKIEAPDHCPRYTARLLEDIRVESSPFWLKNRLWSVGLRPINNIVDITNFILLETGQPLHAFDFDRLAQHRIVVRTARRGEVFVTLDQKERVLDGEMIMICDGEKPVAVGGVMGGLNSEIENSTSRVLIESAYFNPISIRKTSKKLGLNTEASHRFERGTDPAGTIRAVNRAAKLMAKVSGGALVPGLIDEYPKPQPIKKVLLSVKGTNRLLGMDLDRNRIKNLLGSIEFKADTIADNNGNLLVTVPTFRVDISRPEDLMEEVARLSGYDRIPTTFPTMPAQGRPPSPRMDLRGRMKRLLTGAGFTEVITYSFIHQDAPERLRLDPHDPRRKLIHILNPLREDQTVMRTSLVPGLLETVSYNSARQVKNLKLFEIGKIFIPSQAQPLPHEPEMLTALWAGNRSEVSWHARENPCDFYDMKGIAEGLLDALKIKDVCFTRTPPESCRYTRPGYTAQIRAGDQELGLVGEIHPQVRASFELKQVAFIFELEVDKIAAMMTAVPHAKPIPKFPAVYRDITVIVDRAIETQTILQAIERMKANLVENWYLFDVFEGSPIAAGKKSVSFRLTYRSPDKTLGDDDVNDLHKSLTAELLKAFNASLPA
jgi:phenylalanyl-tRNA synthetase beta chain